MSEKDSSRFTDLDDIDRAILVEIERDGRISNTELAARVGVAESTCHKRMRALTRRVYFLAGDRDFLVHVAVRDAQALRELVADTISVREEVAGTTTNLIFEHAPRRHR